MAGGPGARLRAPGGVQGQRPSGGSRGRSPPKPEGEQYIYSTTGEAISWGKMSKLENKFFNVQHKKVNK